MAIEKIKILGAVLELPAKQHCQFWPIWPNFEVNGLDLQCYFAGSSKTAPRILIGSEISCTDMPKTCCLDSMTLNSRQFYHRLVTNSSLKLSMETVCDPKSPTFSILSHD